MAGCQPYPSGEAGYAVVTNKSQTQCLHQPRIICHTCCLTVLDQQGCAGCHPHSGVLGAGNSLVRLPSVSATRRSGRGVSRSALTGLFPEQARVTSTPISLAPVSHKSQLTSENAPNLMIPSTTPSPHFTAGSLVRHPVPPLTSKETF